jgi:membrane-bound acyltransferase YfiQ involved in biofilm formation
MPNSPEPSFWRRYRLRLFLIAIPAWVVFIVLAYVGTRPRDSSRGAVNTLTVGALPVT